MSVIMVMSVVVIVGHAFPMGMGRYMIMVVYMFVSMLLYDPFDGVLLNRVFVLHNAASLREGTDCSIFRAAADFFQVFHFVCHILSPFLAPELRVRGTYSISVSQFPGPDIPFGIRFNSYLKGFSFGSSIL